MQPTTSHIEYCHKCHLSIKTPKVCAQCGTASYCSIVCQKAHQEIHHPTCRPVSPKEVWGITILPGSPAQPPQFQHELLTIDHRIFLKDGNRQNVCLGSLLCGVPLLWYHSNQVQWNQAVKRRSDHGIRATSPVAANSASTPAESTHHVYSPSSGDVRPHMTGAMSRRSGLGLRCTTSSPVSEDLATAKLGESKLRANDPPPEYNQAAALLCVDPNTGVTPNRFDGHVVFARQDKKLLTRELIETIWKFHSSVKEDSEKAEYNWATMGDLMTRETFQSFQSEYYWEQDAKGRPGFDPL